eukprot:m.373716 g.373716  ORF g.373716 m.373716 type:complete len:132 (+) comp56154_c1_seq2:624-1019(+)
MVASSSTPFDGAASDVSSKNQPSAPHHIISIVTESQIQSRTKSAGPSTSAQSQDDTEENKYARRPMGPWLARVVSNRVPVAQGKAPKLRMVLILLLFVVFVLVLIEISTKVQTSGEDDLLDPSNNQHLTSE